MPSIGNDTALAAATRPEFLMKFRLLMLLTAVPLPKSLIEVALACLLRTDCERPPAGRQKKARGPVRPVHGLFCRCIAERLCSGDAEILGDAVVVAARSCARCDDHDDRVCKRRA
jgi:hypothetical protein